MVDGLSSRQGLTGGWLDHLIAHAYQHAIIPVQEGALVKQYRHSSSLYLSPQAPQHPAGKRLSSLDSPMWGLIAPQHKPCTGFRRRLAMNGRKKAVTGLLRRRTRAWQLPSGRSSM